MFGEYDILMIDDAQNFQDEAIDIFLRQPQAKIFVCNPHQAIFGFAGAMGRSLAKIQATVIMPLRPWPSHGRPLLDIAAAVTDFRLW